MQQISKRPSPATSMSPVLEVATKGLTQLRIKRRFAEWLPQLTAQLQRLPENSRPAATTLLRSTHEEALLSTLRLGIPLAAIRRNQLDRPDWSHAERQEALALYLIRRQQTLSRKARKPKASAPASTRLVVLVPSQY